MSMTLRRLSQILAFGLAALTVWFCVSVAKIPSELEIAVPVYVVLTASIALMFAVSFIGLRKATGGSTIYWRGESSLKQVRSVGLILVAGVGIQLIVSETLDRFVYIDDLSSRALGLLVWTLVPAAFLKFGLVKCPTRLRHSSKLTLLLVGFPAACFAVLLSYHSFSVAGDEPALPSMGPLMVMLAAVIIAATAEEVICRVLLLTALLDLPVSRFQAVFLSSMAFASAHAPLALAQPLFRADWPMLAHAANSYAPLFLSQALFGLILGVVWLRTGSITLVALIHATANVGSMLADTF